MVALQSPKLTVGVRVPGGMPSLSRIRLAAMPPGLGPGFRRFESFMRDQFYTALDFWVGPWPFKPKRRVRFPYAVPV